MKFIGCAKNKKIIPRADIKIGFACNNLCKFCIQGDKREMIAVKPKKEIQRNLKQAYGEGAKEVVFTGGEPTLHPKILDFVKFAKKIGYEKIQIQSNGRRFAYFDFCKEIIRAGANEFSFSIHGHTSKIHDFLTSSAGSFNQAVAGIKNLKRLGQRVIANTVITATNYKHLHRIAKLLVGLGVDQYQFAFIHIGGTVLRNKKWIIPRKKLIVPYVKRGLDAGIKAGKMVMVEAIPYCLMRGYEDYVSDKYIPRAKVYDADYIIEDHTEYRLSEGKAKGPDCRKCCYFDICEGPWKEYPELFGWTEFKPIKFLNNKLNKSI